MNAERLQIARRLVACPKWQLLPGMKRIDPRHPTAWQRIISAQVRETDVLISATCATVDPNGCTNLPMVYTWSELKTEIAVDFPDLDDDLTRLGVLSVVRQAYGTPLLCTYPVKMTDCEPWWNVGIPWSREGGGVFCATAPTELAAMLGALEAVR